MTINSVAQDISETGYTTTGLRDEIYIQLCKQVIIFGLTSKLKKYRTKGPYQRYYDPKSAVLKDFSQKSILWLEFDFKK